MQQIKKLAPPPGFEPGTLSLTATCSTAELQGNKDDLVYHVPERCEWFMAPRIGFEPGLIRKDHERRYLPGVAAKQRQALAGRANYTQKERCAKEKYVSPLPACGLEDE